MPLTMQPVSPPLYEDASGALRIKNTRVLLELVIRAFQDGATPETIVSRYSSLLLADVYAVIAYYLNHREEVEHYLNNREKAAEEIHERISANQADLREIRSRLLNLRNYEMIEC